MACAFSSVSYAAESVDFINKDAFKEHAIAPLLSQYEFSYIARVDLNNDSIDEYILSHELGNSFYHFDIVAQTDGNMAELGSFEARKMMIAYDENHGVRSVLGFNAPDNDFEYDVYQWDPVRSHFVNESALKAGGVQ